MSATAIVSTTHVVMMSSGAGSWAAAKRVVEKHGTENVFLLFCDVKGTNPSPHAGEDPDNYRFLRQAAANVGAPLVWLMEGRDIWQVFADEHMLGNNRAPICSMRLKQEPARRWMEANCDPESTIIHLGLDWTEEHRHEKNRRGWAPWTVEYPMMWEPWIDKGQVFDWLQAEGIAPPSLYDLGFAHANCGGFCVQMGQKDARRLLLANPERYAYHEDREQAFRAEHGDFAFMVDRRHDAILTHFNLAADDVERRDDKKWYVRSTGERLPGRVPLTMRTFRERLEQNATLFDASDEGPCACFPFNETETPVGVNNGRGSDDA